MEAVGEELAGELWFAAETVDYPGLYGFPLFPECDYLGEGFYYVENQGFAEGFAQFIVDTQEGGLGCQDFGSGEAGEVWVFLGDWGN